MAAVMVVGQSAGKWKHWDPVPPQDGIELELSLS